jgi:hypothetical protein
MKREFVETEFFQRCWNALHLTDSALSDLQNELLENPEVGAVMQGTGGARKMRIALPGAGKSGGARVIYLDVPVKERAFLLMAYPKSKQDNLTAEQAAKIKDLIQRLKQEE